MSRFLAPTALSGSPRRPRRSGSSTPSTGPSRTSWRRPVPAIPPRESSPRIRPRRGPTGATRIARSIYEAGHHTTFQHAHFQFALENVSRQFLWSVPPLPPLLQLGAGVPALRRGEAGQLRRARRWRRSSGTSTRATARRQQEAYARLTELLTPLAGERYFGLFPGRTRGDGRTRFAGSIKKRAQEIARYVLPVATFAYLYHTISGITLFRYWRLCESMDAPDGAARGRRADGGGGPEARPALRLGPRGSDPARGDARVRRVRRPCRACAGPGGRAFRREFDAGSRRPRLEARRLEGEQRRDPRLGRARGARVAAGGALGRRRDPHGPRPGAEPLARRDADADDPRQALPRALPPVLHVPQEALAHGRQPGPAPPHDAGLAAGAAGVPARTSRTTSSRCSSATSPRRTRSTARPWTRRGRPSASCAPAASPTSSRRTCCPTPSPIRFTESADLLNLHHKFAMRLCYNAQEEIWRASLDEALQIREVNPADRAVAAAALHAAPPRGRAPGLPRGRALLRRRRLETGPGRLREGAIVVRIV